MFEWSYPQPRLALLLRAARHGCG